ncbi:dolichyl-diphosphooligosaccharide--protein glycosyltransferase subunit STT3, putative [Plasmodium vinckei vinckei]|uniref:dolichyl-diphosphooligosaccharide--protein glycotransferase n=1 Tax=Plasmodium vinckei vinckei TaxID=54757 RepID=A0A449BSF1_PLAVN|nr:dolichyl-diphosphooligosaccharide--protein glycosyltransferase subunit STT3, putative [Plasmodium vinckei vinckei]KEG02098.1 dolichyl-diphosphooligosaccharide-protein glycosyltransferase [Plasmodium vinckei vinckei]VEV56338.1 dolichyl-diphosphooligosaccharide--protein glycosyltransferase subunit STT3, putative [Plasmodium vinckei vinckei]
MVKGNKRINHTFEVLILILIVVLCFIIRLFSVIRNESIIHEYDPYFNYKLSNLLKENGFYSFWNYFDDMSWFPLGRATGQTLFPGLMITTYLIHKICYSMGLLIDIKIICIYIGPVFSVFTCILTYYLTKEVYNKKGRNSGGAALIAALFVSISPAHISRTIAGSYDNESISIFLLILCVYNWIKCLKEGTLFSVVLCSLSTYFMGLSWGAYIFIINSISLFMLAIIILKKYNIKYCIIYNVYYILTTMLCLNIPCINKSIFTSIEHLAMHGIYLISNLLLFCNFITNIFNLNEEKIKNTFIKICFIIFFLIFKFLIFTDKLSWSHRSRTLLDPTYASKHNPIVASISEHQPTTWGSYYFDIHLVLFFLPIGLYECFKKNANIELFFLGIFTTLCMYFSSLMVRLLLIFSPFVSILSSIGLSFILSTLIEFVDKLREIKLADLDENDKKNEDKCSTSNNLVKQNINNAKLETKQEQWNENENKDIVENNCNNVIKNKIKEKKIPNEISENKSKLIIISILSIIVLLFFLGVLIILHSTWCASIAYSESNITFYSRNNEGGRYINDDIRQMYKWIKENTERDSKIIAWWDYGYQLNAMSNRITYVDNNTWNNDQIANIGLILSSNEKNGYEELKKFDPDYLLISYGGYSKNSSDDLNKFLWIIKIANKKYNFISPLLYYYHENAHPLGSNATSFMANSILYKLSYYNITNEKVKGFDYARKIEVPKIQNLKYFEEVFTSDIWGFRLYKIKQVV